MDVFQATPIIESDHELRLEIEYLVAQVGQGKDELVKTQEDVDYMMAKAGGIPWEDLEKVKTRYERHIKNFNKNRKAGFRDFELAWNGICPGCDKCTAHGTQQPTLAPRHAIESLDTTLEAITIRIFSEGVLALSQRLFAIYAPNSSEDAEAEAKAEFEAEAEEQENNEK